jgi:catechol 2,3-dioxygenase-like lactoylglutathione lyase family enzyme
LIGRVRQAEDGHGGTDRTRHSDLPDLSIEKAREFYVDFLAFALDWEHRFAPEFPLYMQVSREGLVLHLSEHYGDATPGSTVFVEMADLDGFHAEITAKAYRYMRPDIEDVPWGRQMTVTDPFGNRLRFNEYKPS